MTDNDNEHRKDNKLSVSTLESWLWEAATQIRGPLDAPKFKDYILPLIFLKRLSDVFDDEIKHHAQDLGGEEQTLKLVEEDHKLVRFYIPPKAHWGAIAKQTTNVGQYLTDAVRAIARENPRLSGVIDIIDFNATAAGQRIVDEEPLQALIQTLSKHRLGLDDVDPDILGRAYEYLLRKFAEGQGQSAGEFYTPGEVAILMAHILDPQPGMSIYDPAAGSGGLLIKSHLRLFETHGKKHNGRKKLPNTAAPLKLYGQEVNPSTYAMARMNTVIHDMEASIKLGDTIHRPAFTKNDGSLQQFDLVTANPMWNQKFNGNTYENDPYNRFAFGIPTGQSADWGWVQHMYASLTPKGRMAVVLDTGAVSRGSGNQGSNKERDIRKAFVEKDLVEAVILLPENLFYNTTAPGIILVINKDKQHKNEILLINATQLFDKRRPKNYLTPEHIAQIHQQFADWKSKEKLSAVIITEEAAQNDFNLSPSRYVTTGAEHEVLPPEEAVVLLREAEEESSKTNEALHTILKKLGL
jgi:type I restriction enzyme M protein